MFWIWAEASIVAVILMAIIGIVLRNHRVAVIRGIETFGEWSLEKFPVLLLRIIVVVTILLLAVQVGIHKGKSLERADNERQYKITSGEAE